MFLYTAIYVDNLEHVHSYEKRDNYMYRYDCSSYRKANDTQLVHANILGPEKEG